MLIKEIITYQEELKPLAKKILTKYIDYKIFAFYGEMGVGKTTFIKELVNYLGGENISSPTFSIVNEYPINKKEVYHFDFYRIENINEAYDIGVEEYFYSGNYCFIEWAEKVEQILPNKVLFIKINTFDNGKREFIISNKK